MKIYLADNVNYIEYCYLHYNGDIEISGDDIAKARAAGTEYIYTVS